MKLKMITRVENKVRNALKTRKKLIARHTYPFLSIGVGQVVNSLRVPLLPDAEEVHRKESVLSHDHEVHEEAGSGLDHADLAVCHRNQPADFISVIYFANRSIQLMNQMSNLLYLGQKLKCSNI